MAKFLDDSVYDAALGEVATGTRLTICSGQPADFAGIAGVSLGDVVMTGGDYTISDAAPNGRKTTVATKVVTPTGGGTVTVLAIDDGATLLATTDLTTPFNVNIGEPANTGSFEVTFPDAV